MKGKRIGIAVGMAVLMVALVALPLGCGGEEPPDLAYDTAADNPVVMYFSYKAIAPVYNPTAPVAVVYGDGTLVKKDDPYRYTSGKLEAGVDGLLQTISNEGFFGLKTEYEGEQMAGGATEVISVSLEEKPHTVTVSGNKAPANWDTIVDSVTNAQVSAPEEYIPPAARLFANKEEGPPSAPKVMEWPGDPTELERASADGTNGLKLEGEQARLAWKAMQEAMSTEGEAVWKAGDSFYSYVYTYPIFPGIPEKR